GHVRRAATLRGQRTRQVELGARDRRRGRHRRRRRHPVCSPGSAKAESLRAVPSAWFSFLGETARAETSAREQWEPKNRQPGTRDRELMRVTLVTAANAATSAQARVELQ